MNEVGYLSLYTAVGGRETEYYVQQSSLEVLLLFFSNRAKTGLRLNEVTDRSRDYSKHAMQELGPETLSPVQ